MGLSVIDPSNYEPVIKAIQSARQTGVSISAGLAELETDLEAAQDAAPWRLGGSERLAGLPAVGHGNQ